MSSSLETQIKAVRHQIVSRSSSYISDALSAAPFVALCAERSQISISALHLGASRWDGSGVCSVSWNVRSVGRRECVTLSGWYADTRRHRSGSRLSLESLPLFRRLHLTDVLSDRTTPGLWTERTYEPRQRLSSFVFFSFCHENVL